MLKLDIGCGDNTRANFTGVDVIGNPDVRCDIEQDKLPFDNASADEIFSAHCLEHIAHNRLAHVFQEMTRVCADGARIELWHPYAFHRDAFVIGHINYLSESIYDHLGCIFRDYWENWLGGKWFLREIRYGVDQTVIDDLKQSSISVEFGVSYLHDVVREIGIFINVDRTDDPGPSTYQRTVCAGRENVIIQLADGPRR